MAYGQYGWGAPGGGLLGRWFGGMPPVTAWLLKANIVVALVFWLGEMVGSAFLGQLYVWLALSVPGVKAGMFWQPVTYMFLHGGFWHLLLNMLTLAFMGPETERSMGALHFGLMYLLSGIAGALGWMWLTPGGICVGASGAIFGVMGAFATLYPRRRLTFLIYFFPVTMEAWKAVVGLTVVQMLLIGGGTGVGIAYAAHVLGALAGFLYIDRLYESAHFRRGLQRVAQWFGRDWHFKMPDWRRRGGGGGTSGDDRPSEEEVNRILDKISREGIQSLTREERQTLHRASARF